MSQSRFSVEMLPTVANLNKYIVSGPEFFLSFITTYSTYLNGKDHSTLCNSKIIFLPSNKLSVMSRCTIPPLPTISNLPANKNVFRIRWILFIYPLFLLQQFSWSTERSDHITISQKSQYLNLCPSVFIACRWGGGGVVVVSVSLLMSLHNVPWCMKIRADIN